jgi:hypothetical protein
MATMTPSEKDIEDELQAIEMSKYREAQVRVSKFKLYLFYRNFLNTSRDKSVFKIRF